LPPGRTSSSLVINSRVKYLPARCISLASLFPRDLSGFYVKEPTSQIDDFLPEENPVSSFAGWFCFKIGTGNLTCVFNGQHRPPPTMPMKVILFLQGGFSPASFFVHPGHSCVVSGPPQAVRRCSIVVLSVCFFLPSRRISILFCPMSLFIPFFFFFATNEKVVDGLKGSREALSSRCAVTLVPIFPAALEEEFDVGGHFVGAFFFFPPVAQMNSNHPHPRTFGTHGRILRQLRLWDLACTQAFPPWGVVLPFPPFATTPGGLSRLLSPFFRPKKHCSYW